MAILDYSDKKVAILGMGIEGLALAEFLVDGTKELTLLDHLEEKDLLSKLPDEDNKRLTNIIRKGANKVFGKNYLLKTDYDVLFRSPGISANNPAIKKAKDNGVEITSQIKLFFDLCPAKIIGVTGTKGKGTTASLIFEILKKWLEMRNEKGEKSSSQFSRNLSRVYLAGNIGYPAITLLNQIGPEDYVVLELSSFQLMDLHKSPHVAVVTNLSVDHLDYHKNEEEYRGAKKNIVKYQKQNDFAILNADSTFETSFIKSLRSKIKYFSTTLHNVDAFVTENKAVLDPIHEHKEIADLSKIKLFGRHNLENISAAALAAQTLGIENKLISETAAGFKGLPHRIEFVRSIDGVKYINDSFATNPEPTMAAIDSFKEDKILILGGSYKGADFSLLAKKIASSNVPAVILIGIEARRIKEALISERFEGQIVAGGKTIQGVVEKASKISKRGSAVILSPACASFDMFDNYKDRGEKFKASVKSL